MNLSERIGAAIQRASAELPKGYDLLVELKKDGGGVLLFIPPVGDEDGGQVIKDFDGDNLADYINNAIWMAVRHHEKHVLELEDASTCTPV